MTGFSELEDQLLDAIERKGSRRRPRASALIVAGSSAMVLALAAVAIVALGHRKPPTSPTRMVATAKRHHGEPGRGATGAQRVFSEPQASNATRLGPATAAEIRAVNAAINAVGSKDHQCRLGAMPKHAATFSQGTPSATMLSLLGVLRQPATPADRLPGPVARSPFPFARGVYSRYIRLARVVNGVSYYVIPAAQAGQPPAPAAVLNRCYSEQMQALRARLRNATPSLRASALSYGARLFASIRTSRASQRVHEGVFYLAWPRGGGYGGGGQSPQMIAQRGMLDGTGSTFTGIVPSGVASVALEWSAGGGKEHTPRTVTADVVNNVFVATLPRTVKADAFPPKQVWRATNGRVIKVVRNP